MKNFSTSKSAVFVLSVTFASVSIGCLDLNLQDDMKPIDADTAEVDNGEYEEWTASASDSESGPPKADENDTSPPQIISLACSAGERTSVSLCIAEGPASASVRIRTDEPSTLRWAIENNTTVKGGLVTADWAVLHTLVLVGFSAETDVEVSLRIQDVNGNEQSVEETLRSEGGPTVAVTEVLADPLGAEPSQEFVEIANFGDSPQDLSGYMIDDNDDRNGDVLPDGTILEPGRIALLVSADFVADDGEDPAPNADTQIIVLDKALGSNGLRNGEAERVVLYDKAGTVVSAYGGLAGTIKEGSSASRRYAELPDACDEAFSTDESGQSSPGFTHFLLF